MLTSQMVLRDEQNFAKGTQTRSDMFPKGSNQRWLLVLVVTAMLASACGGSDTIGETGFGGSKGPEVPDEVTPDKSDDSIELGLDSADEPVAQDSASSDSALEPSGGEEFDCGAFDAAVEATAGLVGGDRTSSGGIDARQQFDAARATLLALKGQAPDIAADIDAVVAGLDAIADVYAEVGWATDFEADPVAGARFVQAAFNNPAIPTLLTSVPIIALWLEANCGA